MQIIFKGGAKTLPLATVMFSISEVTTPKTMTIMIPQRNDAIF